MDNERDSSNKKRRVKAEKKYMTVQEAGRLGGQRVKELIEEGRKAKGSSQRARDERRKSPS